MASTPSRTSFVDKSANKKSSSSGFTPMDYLNRQKKREADRQMKREEEEKKSWRKGEGQSRKRPKISHENETEENTENDMVDPLTNTESENGGSNDQTRKNAQPLKNKGKSNIFEVARRVYWDESNDCCFGLDKIETNFAKMKLTKKWNEDEFLLLADEVKENQSLRDLYLLEALKCRIKNNKLEDLPKTDETTGVELTYFRFKLLDKHKDAVFETPSGVKIKFADIFVKENTFTSVCYDTVVRETMARILDHMVVIDKFACTYTPPPKKTEKATMVPLSEDFLITNGDVIMNGCDIDFENDQQKHAQMNRTIDVIRSKTTNYLNKYRQFYKSKYGDRNLDSMKSEMLDALEKAEEGNSSE